MGKKLRSVCHVGYEAVFYDESGLAVVSMKFIGFTAEEKIVFRSGETTYFGALVGNESYHNKVASDLRVGSVSFVQKVEEVASVIHGPITKECEDQLPSSKTKDGQLQEGLGDSDEEGLEDSVVLVEEGVGKTQVEEGVGKTPGSKIDITSCADFPPLRRGVEEGKSALLH